ncbi:MAG TPA: hypothetical protein PK794_14235 [Armatimonadota bacterium]|nr:hypothetical protein [Armatimonadota bacterium]
MIVPPPDELLETYGHCSPEELAGALGIAVVREATPPPLPGVTVYSAYRPTPAIFLYTDAIHALAARRGQSPAQLEQWHIAHELYHALAESRGHSPWRAAETAADLWADELLSLYLHR